MGNCLSTKNQEEEKIPDPVLQGKGLEYVANPITSDSIAGQTTTTEDLCEVQATPLIEITDAQIQDLQSRMTKLYA